MPFRLYVGLRLDLVFCSFGTLEVRTPVNKYFILIGRFYRKVIKIRKL